MSNKKNNPSPVVDYMKKFLASDSSKLMEYCYFSIRNQAKGRSHREQIKVLEDSNFDAMFPLISCVILTANKIECDSLNYIFSQQKNAVLQRRKHLLPIFPGNNFGAPEAYIYKLNSSFILHLRAYETGANTPGGSTDLVRYISRHPLLRPSSIISFGICYGRDTETQEIGDVIIPQKLYPWSIGQKISEGKFSIKHDNFNLWLEEKFSSSKIYSSLRDFCNGDEGRYVTDSLTLYSSETGSCLKRNFSTKVTLGNMSTGEAVVSSAKAKKLIQQSMHNEKELGGEMEGYGLAKECIYYANIPCLIIKAICDWGEAKNIDQILKKENISYPPNLKDKLQAYAAFCAGIVLMQLLTSEKDLLLSLKLIQWMGDNKKANCIDKNNYAEEDAILRYIKKFYNVKPNTAYKIFDILKRYQVVICDKRGIEYHVNPEL